MTVEQQQLGAGQDILARRKREREKRVFFPAFSRVVLEDEAGEQRVFWLVERFVGDLQVHRNWTRTPTGGTVTATALDEGHVVSKNAPLGLILDQFGEQLGEQVRLPDGATATVLGCTHYIPRGSDATDGSMFVGSVDPLHFVSLKSLVEDLRPLVGEPDTPEQLEVGIGAIKALLQEREQRIQAFREATKDRIRHVITSAALRNQPKLDVEQLQAKQLQILDGQVIIHGGPGTGKTTALLDRITLLTDRAAIREHVPTLSDAAIDRLTHPDTAYLLFTPNELLLLFLKEAMNRKGLLADGTKLTTWRRYRDHLALQMGFLTADPEKSRFLKNPTSFREDVPTFDVQADEWQAFFSVLCGVFSEFVARRHRQILKIDADASSDPELVRHVQDRLATVGKARSFSELMGIFQSLYARKHKAATEAHRAGTDRLSTLATRLHAKIEADETGHRRLLAALAELQRDSSGGSEADGQASRNADQQVSNETTNEDVEIVNSLARNLLRKLALRRGLVGIRLTERERIMLEHVRIRIDDKALEAVAPALLTGLVRSACAGADRNIVAPVGLFYLWLRRTHFSGRLHPFLHPDVRDRLAKAGAPKGKSIDPEELDLVLLLQLWLLRLRRAHPSFQRSRRSNLSTVFESSMREIIAVDEANDFSPMQLACMAMLANPDYDCVTLSGDLMQRMTHFGLRGWEEYKSVAGEVGLAAVHSAGLKVSYRQSHRLLAVTNRLYEASTGNAPPTISPYPPSEHDPPPLLHVGTDHEDCANWIARRVVEIRQSYADHRVVPTIAVLVPNESSVDTLTEALENSPSLGENVEIDPCHRGRVLGEAASVRIFNVEHIKGVEFEAAFFHDMGAIAIRFPELAERMLYVGLSRASLYLGITVIGEVPEALDPIASDLEKERDWSG